MSINYIKRLSMNPHFYSLLMQSFLSGYGKPCEIKLPFMAIPILLYAESREKLVSANKRSRIDTLFQSPQIINENKISGKTRLSGYINRYNSLKQYCKEAIIILSSERKIAITNHKIVLIKKIDYRNFDGTIKEWIRSAFYLGIVFSKTTEDHLSFFLGVDRPINLNFGLTDGSFDVYQHQKSNENIHLYEMGSGANWVSCHIALFLSFLHYFAAQDTSPMPLIMFFDQPSQVYFPQGDDKDEITQADLIAVNKMYKTIFDEINLIGEDTGILPQIIIVDHVDGNNLECKKEFNGYVRCNWRNGTALI